MPRRSDEPHDRTYTCDQCGGTFTAARDDEDAQVEAVEMFGKRGDHPDMAIVPRLLSQNHGVLVMVTATWNRGLLVSNADESRFVQIVVGRGSRVRRLLWLPDWNRIGLRVWSDWWLSLNWKRA